MTIFKKETVIASYPTYDVVTREKANGAIQITANETLVVGGKLGAYRVGTSTSYALKYNECPIEARERDIKNGHESYWIGACASTLTSAKTEKETHLQVDFNATYNLEGRQFKITIAPNRNLKFVSA